MLTKRQKFWRVMWLLYAVVGIACFALTLYGCSARGNEKAAVSAADIVNEVVHRGDQVYGVSVQSCHTAEQAAAELPEPAEAERAVARIRAACDHAFQALDLVALAVKRVDEIMAQAEAGAVPVRDVVAAALDARAVVEAAQAENAELAMQLQKGGP
jgi:uncharacterized protein YhaN